MDIPSKQDIENKTITLILQKRIEMKVDYSFFSHSIYLMGRIQSFIESKDNANIDDCQIVMENVDKRLLDIIIEYHSIHEKEGRKQGDEELKHNFKNTSLQEALNLFNGLGVEDIINLVAIADQLLLRDFQQYCLAQFTDVQQKQENPELKDVFLNFKNK